MLFTASHAAPQLEFEVATIKPHTSSGAPDEVSGGDDKNGLLRIDNLPLKAVIELAYGVRDFQFEGPGWLSAPRFDIRARLPTGYTSRQFQPLLQNLLADRFKLTVHHASKQTPAFAMVISKGGSRFHESAGPRGFFTARPGLISGTRVSIKELAAALAGMVDWPVVDRTALTGAYDLKLGWTPDQATQTPEAGPSIFTALQEQLGLRMQTTKPLVDVVIVDHVERVPSEN